MKEEEEESSIHEINYGTTLLVLYELILFFSIAPDESEKGTDHVFGWHRFTTWCLHSRGRRRAVAGAGGVGWGRETKLLEISTQCTFFSILSPSHFPGATVDTDWYTVRVRCPSPGHSK